MENSVISFLLTILKGFVASLPMLLFASFAVPKYLDYRRRPKLAMTNRRTDDGVFAFEREADGAGWKASFEIGIQNDGLTAQRDWYWNLFVPADLSPRLSAAEGTLPEPRQETVEDYRGERWVRFMGKVSDAVYPGRNYLFPFRVELSAAGAEPPADRSLYYFFGTEFGLSPASARRLGNRVRLTEAAFGGALGRVAVRMP